MSARILITGSGQLGSRYLQGLANCQNTLDIYVQDIYKQSLQIAKQRWEEACQTNVAINGVLTDPSYQNQITFVSSFDKLPKQIDIAIVAVSYEIALGTRGCFVTICGGTYQCNSTRPE